MLREPAAQEEGGATLDTAQRPSHAYPNLALGRRMQRVASGDALSMRVPRRHHVRLILTVRLQPAAQVEVRISPTRWLRAKVP